MKNAFNSAAWLCEFVFAGLQWLGLVVLRLGFKIKPEHVQLAGEPTKGMTFKPNPWKSI